MADITKCSGVGCPIKESCHRYTAPSGFLQSYSDFKFDEEKGCDYFWNNKVNVIR